MDMAESTDETARTLLSADVYAVQGKKLRLDMQFRTWQIKSLNADVKSLDIIL